MKIAILHDSLVIKGGAEKVVLAFAEMFPQADLYTLCFNPTTTYPEFTKYKVFTSFFQRISATEKAMKLLMFPFGILSMYSLNLKHYDVLLISSTHCAKYVRPRAGATVIHYCHSPFRLAWEPNVYPVYNDAIGLKKLTLRAFIYTLRIIDRHFAKPWHYYITNSTNRATLIQKVYNLPTPPVIIFPPVDTTHFPIEMLPRRYFLVVSRLEAYKRVDLVIETFNALKLPLVVVGYGTQEKMLHELAGPTVTFKKDLSDEELSTTYRQAHALIFPQLEDFGITPLEANAAGVPVIAYGRGGVLHTQIPFDGQNSRQCTALFFDEQTPEALQRAVLVFDANCFSPDFLRQHAQTFGKKQFQERIMAYLQAVYTQVDQ